MQQQFLSNKLKLDIEAESKKGLSKRVVSFCIYQKTFDIGLCGIYIKNKEKNIDSEIKTCYNI